MAGLLICEFIIVLLFLDESYTTEGTPSGQWILRELRRLSNLWTRRPTGSSENQDPDETSTLLEHEAEPPVPQSSTFSFDTFSMLLIIIIGTSAISHFCSSAYNKLLIDLLSSPPPVGFELSAKEIGYVWSTTAMCSIIVQFLLFTKISNSFGYAKLYTATLFVLSASWFFTPFVGGPGSTGFWVQLVLSLSLRKIVDISSFACYLLLV